MQYDVETKHRHMYSLYIGSLFNIPYCTFNLHRDFTGILEKLIAMKHSIEPFKGVEKTFMISLQLQIP